jgi:hypothetical protein
METYLGRRVPIKLGKKIIAILAPVVVVVLLARAVGKVGVGERGDSIAFLRCDRNDVGEKPVFQLPYVHKLVRMSPQILKCGALATSCNRHSQRGDQI